MKPSRGHYNAGRKQLRDMAYRARFNNVPLPLVELLAAPAAAEALVALSGALGSLRQRFRAALDALHLRPPPH